MDIARRKDDHIEICLKKDVQVDHVHWDEVGLVHEAIPSTDMEDIDISAELLGKRLEAPIVISPMTGGGRRAREINEVLAKAASEYGLAMGVGSQRAALENGEHLDSYSLMKEYDIPLVIGNIGAPQFSSGGSDTIDREKISQAIDMIGADALYLHLNYLQEVIQPEGETRVKGLLDNLEEISSEFDIVAKETGAGISRSAALSLKESGVKAIDIAGSSGTSFAAVESYRSGEQEVFSRMGKTFWNWGIPSPISLLFANVGLPLIGSGGIRSGLDIMRALAMGASASGMAWHLLLPASKGYDELSREIENLKRELRSALFLSGVDSVHNAGSARYYLTGRTREIYLQIGRM